jgi:hypothetical protein
VSSPWWKALGPAQATVSCGGEQHVIRWAEGQLLAASHPDTDSELVLAALGGEAPRCVEILQAWGAHADDLEVLMVGPRSAADRIDVSQPTEEDQLARSRPFMLRPQSWASPRGELLFRRTAGQRRQAMTGQGASAARRGLARTGPMMAASAYSVRNRPGRPGPDPALERARARWDELRALLALGTDFQWRLSGTVAASWSEPEAGRDQEAAGPALTAALAGRLAPVARAWPGVAPDRVTTGLHRGPGWGSVASTSDGLAAALPPDWLARVWAPGLALVGGHLVVAVLEASWPQATVLALARPGSEPAELSVHWTAGQWVRGTAPGEQGSDQRGGK